MFDIKWIKENSEVIIAITALCAIIISFMSIILTLISLFLQRKHNRKSVKPIGNIAISDYENLISVEIFNRGSGPLIIKEFTAEYRNIIKNNLISLMPFLPENVSWSTFFDELNEFSILPGESINLLEFKPDLENIAEVNFRNEVRKVLSEIKVTLKYSDIYDCLMPIKVKKLSWFGRHF